jgi:hypothetical protein|tara:strand:+ start:4303 stop:4773 length:471 start_codon:yes stop_codon:yes gene_type:complete
MANKELDLFKVLIPAIDNNMKELYDAATDVGKNDIKGDIWNLNRYISSVKGSFEKQALAVFKVNEYYNKNWNVLGGTNHIKLQWQLLCVAGNTGKQEFHPWIKLERKKDTSNKAIKILSEIYPTMKWEEVEILARISTKKEIKQLASDHGYEKVDI